MYERSVIAFIFVAAPCLFPFQDSAEILRAERDPLNRAESDQAAGNPGAAEEDYLKAREFAHRLLNRDYHLETNVLWKLGRLYSKTKRFDLAENIYRERLGILLSRNKGIDLDLGIALFDLQSLYEGIGRDADAKQMMERGSQFYTGCKTNNDLKQVYDRRLADVQGLYGAYLFEHSRFAEAEPYLKAVAARPDEAVRPEILEASLLSLSSIYFQKGKRDESEANGRRALKLRGRYPEARLVPLPEKRSP